MTDKERTVKIVKQFKYRNRKIVIISLKWCEEAKQIASSLHDYCNGYVSITKRNQKKGVEYSKLPIHSTELTFSGKLDHLDKTLKDIQFVDFDLTHSWNNAENSTPECAEKIAKELADEMVRKGY